MDMHLTAKERRLQGVRMTPTQRVSINRVFRSSLYPDIDQTGKGQFGGKCNVTACRTRGEDVKWWNRPMRAFYCTHCKVEISRFDDYHGTPQQIFENAPRTDAHTPVDGRED
jgi:hypothetical protein